VKKAKAKRTKTKSEKVVVLRIDGSAVSEALAAALPEMIRKTTEEAVERVREMARRGSFH
jgi:hypothetical protein